MKGYKATRNMKCETLTYEVGKTYEIDNIQICSHGFHYCRNQKDVLKYYPWDKDFVLLEIEDLGEGITDGNKTCTNKLRVVRVIPKEEYEFDFEIPLVEYDSNNNLIYRKNSKGYEYWKEYDSKGNVIHYKDSYGNACWKEYDSNNNLIHHKNSDGYEEWWDSKGNEIHYKNSNGYEWWKEYDSNNNLIHYKNSDGYEYWKEYDSEGNVIHFKDSYGYEWRIEIKD